MEGGVRGERNDSQHYCFSMQIHPPPPSPAWSWHANLDTKVDRVSFEKKKPFNSPPPPFFFFFDDENHRDSKMRAITLYTICMNNSIVSKGAIILELFGPLADTNNTGWNKHKQNVTIGPYRSAFFFWNKSWQFSWRAFSSNLGRVNWR